MKNQKLREQHVIALTVPCTYCGAKPNQPCTNKLTKEPIHNFAAHPSRLKTAEEGMPF